MEEKQLAICFLDKAELAVVVFIYIELPAKDAKTFIGGIEEGDSF